jgi:inorganic pyrophosphatase
MVPGHPAQMSIERVYGCEEALKVVEAAMADYEEEFGG